MQQRLRFYHHRCIYPLTGRAACYVFHILRPVFGCHKKFIRIKPHAVLLPEMLEQKLVKFDIQFLFAAHFFLNLLKMLLIGSFEIIQQCDHQVSGDFFAEGWPASRNCCQMYTNCACNCSASAWRRCTTGMAPAEQNWNLSSTCGLM
jgi:hypothetical protein